jgi:DNA-binding response OmpR family regulator
MAPSLAFCLLILNGMMNLEPQSDTAERPSASYEFKAVLLVDDDRQLAVALQWILADQNFLVDVANDGDEALLKVHANEYDAVICDVMMPRLRGDEFYNKAVECRPDLGDRFIFITGFAADPKINLFLSKTGAKYLMKPFPVNTLIKCVQQLLS